MTIRTSSPFSLTNKKTFTDSKPVQMTYSDYLLSDSNHESKESFKYDPLGYPLKNTQQLNVDWSKFENHTFFSSAEVKVNEAFNKIINSYPFDGTKKEVETFFDSLTGFEKWVFDQFPIWSGALHFSGTQVGEDPANGFPPKLGTWIAVTDKSGITFPDISRNNKGESILNPDDNTSLTFEFFVNLPEIANDNQVLFQKSESPTEGITFYLTSSLSSQNVDAVFSITSGSFRNSVSASLEKGIYNHVCVTLNKEDQHILQFYNNEKLINESNKRITFNKINIDHSDLLIGSGSSFYDENLFVVPKQTFSGTIDEFRVFHSTRDIKSQILYSTRGIYSTSDLKLYYRFNEPTGSLSLNNSSNIETIVLDSSGNSLHANIQNITSETRKNASMEANYPLRNESKEFQKILFPAHQDVLSFNSRLLSEAIKYDRANPNIILKLIPQHYLLEGASQDGFEKVEGNAGDPYGGSGIPGQGQMGSVQIILSFLYIWSKFFDELKIYADSFSTLRTVKYDELDTVPDNFLEDMVRQYGFDLPKFFTHASIDQFVEGQNIQNEDISLSLKKIQSTLLRRVLINIPNVIRSKGTQHSIRSFLRSIGIDPDNSVKIREYGGPNVKQLSTARETRLEPGAMVEFTSSSLIVTPPLSASRVEPGYPYPQGTFYVDSQTGKNLGTTSTSDGLLTSGSWNIECVFRMPPQKLNKISDPSGNQSLFRLFTTGSSTGANPALIANVVATQFVEHPEESSTLQAFLRPGSDSSSPTLNLTLSLNGKGIFDGDKWNVSLGCSRNDSFDSNVSSSYYLRAAKVDDGQISEIYVTSSYFFETPASEDNIFRTINTSYNVSGSYISIGSNQDIDYGLGYYFLNDSLNVDDIARTTDFIGRASNLRFWSKDMSLDEWKEHVRNFKSLGVEDPKKNYNFVTVLSGSFEKIRLDTLSKQQIRTSDNLGEIKFVDYSLNLSESLGKGFDQDSKVLVGELFSYSHLSPSFDESATNDKIRIRSFENTDLLNENPWAVPTPSYLSSARFAQEEVQDDLRLSIEFSMIDSLDRDIINMFSNLDVFNDALGKPELMFSPDYPDLEVLRDVYFNRLTGKPDFRRFLDFYQWFDVSISTFIDQLIPSKTNYKGTNFVVESHVLERHKNSYRHSENYLGRKEIIQDNLLVQQIVGKIRKY